MTSLYILGIAIPVFLIAFAAACIVVPGHVFRVCKRLAEALGHNVDAQVRSVERVVLVHRIVGVLILPISIALLVAMLKLHASMSALDAQFHGVVSTWFV